VAGARGAPVTQPADEAADGGDEQQQQLSSSMPGKDQLNSHPKSYGKGGRQCRMTGRKGGMGLIRKYGINMKRQAFREHAKEMGWEKYS